MLAAETRADAGDRTHGAHFGPDKGNRVLFDARWHCGGTVLFIVPQSRTIYVLHVTVL
jgi:hypothetical protein